MHRTNHVRAALVGLALAASCAPQRIDVLGSEGVLDTTFGDDGRAILSPPLAAPVLLVRGLAAAPNGTLLVAASVEDGADRDAVVARVLDDGRLDPSFGALGLARVDLGVDDDARSVAVASDGGVLLSGCLDERGFVARFDPSGSLVNATVLDLGCANGLVPSLGNEVIAGGQTKPVPNESSDLWAARLRADGSADSSYGDAGVAMVDPSDGDAFGSVSAGAGSGVYLHGSAWMGDGFECFVHRLSESGTADLDFDDFFSGTDGTSCHHAAAGPSRVLLAGFASGDAAFWSLDLAGALQPSFGEAGALVVDLGGDEEVTSLAILPDGRIAAGLRAESTGEVLLLLLDANGEPDPSADDDGVIRLAIDAGDTGAIEGLVVDGEGRLVAYARTSGSAGHRAVLWRLRP